MNILIVNRALGTLFGGGEHFDLNAAWHLTKRGHKATAITAKPLIGKPLKYDEVEVTYVTSPNLRRYSYVTECVHNKVSAVLRHVDNWLFERQVLRWLSVGSRYRKFDVVQCCSLFNLPQ